MLQDERSFSPDRDKAAVLEAIQLTRRGEYEAGLKLFEDNLAPVRSGDLQGERLAAAAYSFYGLCLAKVQNDVAEGVKYCRLSISANLMDPDHCCNLGMIYLQHRDRGNAVRAFHQGLRLAPDHRRIQHILGEIGTRKQPVIRFLRREHPLNIWLGKRRHRRSH